MLNSNLIFFSAQLRNINAAAAYFPSSSYPHQAGYGGHQADELERLSHALKKHGIDCAPLQSAYEAAFASKGNILLFRAQSFTTLMADLRQDMNIVSLFSRCLNGIFI